MKKIYRLYLTYIASFWVRHRRGESNKNILLCKYDKLGDFFIFLPHLQELLRRGYRITLVAPPMLEAIVRYHRLKLKFIPSKTKYTSDVKRIIRRIRSKKYVAAINFSMNAWGGVFVNQADANVKIGLVQETDHYVYKGASRFYDHRLQFSPSPLTIDTYTMAIGKAISGFEIPYNIDALKYSQNIVIHPFANWQPREWPYFADFIRRISAHGERIEIIGTAAEFSRAEWTREFETHKKVHLNELASINELMERVSSARLFIGNDSGPAHYAALLSKPTFVLWGPGNFDRIHPVGADVTIFKKDINCRPCRQVGALCQRGSNDCLKWITVDEVAEKVEERLGK